MQKLILTFFFLALAAAGVLGTETRLLFLWPACALLGAAGLLLALRPKARLHSSPGDVCLGVTLLAVFYFAGRALLSPVADYAREDWIVLCACLVVYAVMATIGASPRVRRLFCWLLLLLALGNFAVGMVHFSGDWAFHIVPSFARAFPEGRIGGFYNNPNHLAAFFSLVVFAGLGLVCFGRGAATWRLVPAFVVISCMLGMALTVSRGGLLALAGGGLAFGAAGLWLVWRCRRHLAGRLLAGCAVAVVILGGVLWKVNEDYLRRRASQQEAGADVRFPIWRAALEQHAEQPWTGAGARLFYDGSVRYRQPEVRSWVGEAEFAHNEYVQTLADYGWVGLGLLALVLAVHFGNGRRFVAWFARERFPRDGQVVSDKLALTVGALAALAASAAHAVVEFHWHVGGLAIFGAAFLGILANPGFEAGRRPARRLPLVRPLLKLALVAASAALLWQSATVGRADWLTARGALLAGQGDTVGALREMRAAVEIDPRSARKAFQLGETLLDAYATVETEAEQRALLDEAGAALERAAALNPFHYLTATTLADVHFAQGKLDRALSEIHRALTLAPLYEEPRLALALFHHRQGHFAEAEAAYLWASRSSAANLSGSVMNWLDGYRQLLMDTGNLPFPEPEP